MHWVSVQRSTPGASAVPDAGAGIDGAAAVESTAAAAGAYVKTTAPKAAARTKMRLGDPDRMSTLPDRDQESISAAGRPDWPTVPLRLITPLGFRVYRIPESRSVMRKTGSEATTPNPNPFRA
jgi:hypothetical protein